MKTHYFRNRACAMQHLCNAHLPFQNENHPIALLFTSHACQRWMSLATRLFCGAKKQLVSWLDSQTGVSLSICNLLTLKFSKSQKLFTGNNSREKARTFHFLRATSLRNVKAYSQPGP